MNGYDFEYALRVSASACTCVQFLSGFLICANFMKKGKVSNESVVPFVTGFLSFYTKTRFPGVIGCIDCTHVALVPPSSNLNLIENQHPEYIYVNCKCYHSINVQLICNSDLKILNANALFPGSTHDSHVWNNSSVLSLLQDLYTNGLNNIYLLGDSGYPLCPWMLTPIANPTTEADEYFNKQQMSARSIIERCNGVLKGRFRCSLWLYYGMILANSTLVSVNAFGCLLFAIYTWIYYRYTSKKKRVIHYVISAIAVIAWIVYITYTNVNRKQSKTLSSAELHQHQTVEVAAVTPLDIADTSIISSTTNDAIDRVGLLCSLTTMLFFAAPFSNLIHVIRTKNTESLPLPLIVMTFLVSAQWLVYGRMLRDKFIMYPNAVGCMLSVIQLALFVIYPRRSAVPLTTELHNHHHPYPYIKLMDA